MTQAAVNNAIVLYRLSVKREDVENAQKLFFTAPQLQDVLENPTVSLAKKYEIPMDETTLLAEANKWELSHGGLSGRTAQQFINYLLGKE